MYDNIEFTSDRSGAKVTAHELLNNDFIFCTGDGSGSEFNLGNSKPFIVYVFGYGDGVACGAGDHGCRGSQTNTLNLGAL